jgi:hypothetical protein
MNFSRNGIEIIEIKKISINHMKRNLFIINFLIILNQI